MRRKFKAAGLLLSVGMASALASCGGAISETEPSILESTDLESMEERVGAAAEVTGDAEGNEVADTGDAEVNYMTNLTLMKGHLQVAEELINAGEYEAAEIHIQHPIEEIYGDVEAALRQKRVPDFKPQLNETLDLAKSVPESPELADALATADENIGGAIAAVPESLRQSPEFVMSVVSSTLMIAAEEYDAAIADNQFVEVVEYQDARGFVLVADGLYQTIAEQVSVENPEAHRTISTNLSTLQEAWPSANPPATPVSSPEAVFALVADISESL